MHLQLVPIDGERTSSDEEKLRQKRRTRLIPPETINYFNAGQQQQIKSLIAKLVVTSEQCHHLISQFEATSDNSRKDRLKDELESCNQRRINIFENLPYFLRYFVKLLDLCPSEPWKELEQFLKNIRNEEIAHYRKTSQSMGIDAAIDNSYLLQIEEDREEANIDSQINCRMTPKEIETLILHHSLEELVKHLVDARRVSSGEFWNKGFYDL